MLALLWFFLGVIQILDFQFWIEKFKIEKRLFVQRSHQEFKLENVTNYVKPRERQLRITLA
ncbi:hypothetical protein A6V25_11120 [Nostoc sp. ATCC 53789]|nr:hypothetical protein A6V25_11120 [Nostoc sp. ATCC 53789]